MPPLGKADFVQTIGNSEFEQFPCEEDFCLFEKKIVKGVYIETIYSIMESVRLLKI